MSERNVSDGARRTGVMATTTTCEPWMVLTRTVGARVRRYMFQMGEGDQLITHGEVALSDPRGYPLVFALVAKPSGERVIFCIDAIAAHDNAGESAVVMHPVDPGCHAHWRDHHGLPVALEEPPDRSGECGALGGMAFQ